MAMVLCLAYTIKVLTRFSLMTATLLLTLLALVVVVYEVEVLEVLSLGLTLKQVLETLYTLPAEGDFILIEF